MQNGRYIIGAPAVLNIAERDARALVDAGDGDAALLYLYALLQGGTLDAARAARLHASPGDALIRTEALNVTPKGQPVERGLTWWLAARITLTVVQAGEG